MLIPGAVSHEYENVVEFKVNKIDAGVGGLVDQELAECPLTPMPRTVNDYGESDNDDTTI